MTCKGVVLCRRQWRPRRWNTVVSQCLLVATRQCTFTTHASTDLGKLLSDRKTPVRLWSRRSRQRERLSASVLSVCSSVCLWNGRGPTSANAPSLSADLIHGTVVLQRSATSTVIQRSDELLSHICFIVLLLINFYFIFYTYIHYLLTIVMHSRPSLYNWALEHFFIIITYH